jgi:DNA invertase Pin-like site-specific DNA recombinase
MRCAIYSRVSTDKQDTENQLTQLTTFCPTQNWELVQTFTDTCSGSKSDRPGFCAMMEAASRREFDVLLFWSLDRLSREGALRTLTHLNRLTEYGVAYRSFCEPYLDSTGMFKDAVISILATIAKQERARIIERTKAGLATARRKGKVLGRPKVDVDVRKAKRLRDAGQSYREIGERLKVSADSVRRAIQ